MCHAIKSESIKYIQRNSSVRRKVYVCQVCEETFERSYQLKRHCFIGEHRGKADPQPVLQTRHVSSPTQLFKRQTNKLISSTVAQPNGIHLSDQNCNPTYIRNTFVNNGKPPLQYGAKRATASKTNVLSKTNGIAQRPVAKSEIEVIKNTAHIKVIVEQPSPVSSNDSRAKFTEDRSTANHNFQKSNTNTTTKRPNTATGSSMYFTSETEHEWNQIVYQVLENVLDEILLKCAVCNFVHSNLSVIDKHLTVHNGTPFRFQCQLCDAWFGQQSYLINHVNGHTVSYLYKCDWCELSFRSSESLRVHTAGEQPDCTFDLAGRQLFQCDVCRKTFLNEHLFRSHNTEMHEGGKPYKCDICKAQYYYLASLTKHHECDITCELPIKLES